MITRIFLILCLNVLSVTAVYAQDWKSILKGVAESVGKEVGEKVSEKVKVFSIEGEWNYIGPDCQFTSDNFLSEASSELIASKVEEQLRKVMGKLGLDSTSVFTFLPDSTYSITMGKFTAKGTYSLNKETKEIVMTSRLGKQHTAKISQNILAPDKVAILFNADKLIAFVQNISNALTLKSSSKTVQAADDMLNQYNGLLLGYELKKRSGKTDSVAPLQLENIGKDSI